MTRDRLTYIFEHCEKVSSAPDGSGVAFRVDVPTKSIIPEQWERCGLHILATESAGSLRWTSVYFSVGCRPPVVMQTPEKENTPWTQSNPC